MKKLRIQMSVVIVVPVFLAGCAGYNTTIFTTKSNAGLDLDMKPPTAEITIARKEAVFEPSFEKGQTPPVMASFKPRVGFGAGFKNYFLGVDQTFAGGDAAKVMSALYDSPTLHGANPNEPAFDSKLELTKPVSGSHIWGLHALTTPAKPGDIRPLVFATDTLLGLKISWSGAAGQFPDSVKAGFNRKEFAWAPLTMTEDGKSIKMPPFLATIQSRIEGGSETNLSQTSNSSQPGGISSIQYFATGDAARNLAFQRDVRDAMLSRLDPHYKRTHLGRNGVVRRQVLDAMQNAFSQLPDDPIAKAYYGQFADLKDIHVPESFEKAHPAMHFYTRSVVGPDVLTQQQDKAVGLGPPLTLPNLLAYLANLDNSRDALNHALGNLGTTQLSIIDSHGVVGAARPISPSDAKDLQAQLDIQTRASENINREIDDNPIIDAALHYFNSLTR